MSFSHPTPKSIASVVLTATVMAASVFAAVVPDKSPEISRLEYRHADLHISNLYLPPSQLKATVAEATRAELLALGVAETSGFLDLRSGRWGTLVLSHPMIPGSGVGNSLVWESAPSSDAEIRQRTWDAFVSYLSSNNSALQIALDQLPNPGRIAVRDGGQLVQIHVPRIINGVGVRESYLTAIINSGNLVLFGARNWGDVEVSTQPQISFDKAVDITRTHLSGTAIEQYWRKPYLELVPMSATEFSPTALIGTGLRYHLVWVVSPRIAGDGGSWEALVDAHSGELLSFTDTNQYGVASTRHVEGGVYPTSNDGNPPDGVEQPDFPMPFADVAIGAETMFTDAGGNLAICVDGTITTTLDGQFVRMNDGCGAINESSLGDIDLGTSVGTDCTVPPGASPGNTHASRTGFYEVNRIKEQARGQLPGNSWLQGQITANMNINLPCNAFWDGNTINFYRSAGNCANTGELAGIFDHEWGHGMDDNDLNPSISNPGEGIADIYAAARLETSCVGRGFSINGGNCGGYGDPCTSCSGIRDIDWANRVSGVPHDIAWIDANCGGGPAPCGGVVHCEGAVYAEAWWDLATRDLPGNANTAHETATRLAFLGSAPVGQWYNCVNGAGTGDGCNADGGYLNYIAADDDDGDLSNGTPHMSAIFAAFDRHDIACPTPTVQESGCAGAPTTAPTVTVDAIDRGASLSWGSVSGAVAYEIYRTDGVFQCDFGRTLVGVTNETSWQDIGLKNGHEYSYNVAAIGSSAACRGPLSGCQSVTPAAGSNVAINKASASWNELAGDGDEFVDNCEQGDISFDITNIGNATANNVRIVGVEVINPVAGVTVLNNLPITVTSSLPTCSTATGSVRIYAQNLTYDGQIVLRVDVTTNQMQPFVSSQFITLGATESDFANYATKTFNFETGVEEWNVIQGTFNRTNVGGGANGTTWYEASSAFLDDQCDQIRSPLIELSSTSTMQAYNQYDIEDFSGQWWDRANFALYDSASDSREAVNPDGGRLYNASGPGASCVTGGQNGWAGPGTGWQSSTWSATALDSVGRAGDKLRLDVAYGTDVAVNGSGFTFDEVTLTDFRLQEPDQQPNSCPAEPIVFADGFESGDVFAWSTSQP